MKRAIKIAVVLLAMILPAGTYMFGETGSDWMRIPLKDISTGENFTVADFAGRPVLLETFAVWCPTCTKQ
jgi:hypothetical protein